MAGLSLFHFVREFHAQMGDSPYRFIQKRRAERSLRLMERKDMPADEIARQSGFSSVRAMRAMMRRHGPAQGGS